VPKVGKKGGSSEVDQIRADEAARQKRIRDGTKRISDMFSAQFTPAYFDQQRDNYLSFATPQLQDQHKDALKQLTFSLDRRGALDSSSRASLEAELEKKRALAAQDIASRALDYRTNAMNNVEGARSNLIATLNATGDAEGAVSSATARAAALSQPTAYNPLSQLFVDFTAGLGQQAAAEKAFAYGAGPKPTYSTGLFGPRSGSVVNQ
jgi:hypothetical protein